MLNLVSYLLLILGSLAVTIAILGRFIWRGETRFDLAGLVRLGLFVGGIALLVGSLLLYAYQFEIDTVFPAVLTP